MGWTGVLFCFMACLPSMTWAQDSEEIIIVKGRQKIIKPGIPIGTTSNSNTRVLEAVVQRDQNQVILFGQRVGEATFIIFDRRNPGIREEYEIRVIGADLDRIRRQLLSAIGDIEGVNIRVVGNQVLIEGEVSLEQERFRIQTLADRFPQVISLVILSPLTLQILASTIERDIGIPEVQARPLKDKILLEGVVYSPEQKLKAEEIAKARHPKIINTLEVRKLERPPGRAKTIVLNVHFLELSKQMFDKWGVKWTPLALSGGGFQGFFQQDLVNGELIGDFNATISGTVSAFLPKFERARASGYIRVLENPIVLVKEGNPVSVFAGASIPFIVGVVDGVPVVAFQEVGINMDVTPYAQGDSVDLKINISVKDIGDVTLSATGLAQSSDNAPSAAIVESKISTTVFARAGESIILGGLFRTSDSVVYNRPSIQSTDAIFELLRSKEYDKRKSQFVIFITPQIHADTSTANRELKELFNLERVSQ